jgi:AcrR family transcriptional regulator
MKRLDTETRKIQIKEAVLQIISSKGLANLSIKNLAKEVGLSEGALYRHYNSKKDIIIDIVNDVYNNLVVNQRKDSERNLPASVKLFNYFCNHIKYLLLNKGITILLFSEAAHQGDTELKKRLLRVLKEQNEILKMIVTEGIEKGIWNSSVNLDDFTTIYMGIPVMLNIEMVLEKEKFDYKSFCDRMFVLLEKVLQ